MKEKRASVLEKVSPDLLVPPHIVDKLAHLFAGKWQPDTVQREQLIAHLTECSDCRTTLIIWLSAAQKVEQEHEQSGSDAEELVHALLTRFVDIHHKIESQEYEQMGAYAETIIAKGKREANKQFPTIAEHIKTCPSCRIMLEKTRRFLRETEQTH